MVDWIVYLATLKVKHNAKQKALFLIIRLITLSPRATWLLQYSMQAPDGKDSS